MIDDEDWLPSANWSQIDAHRHGNVDRAVFWTAISCLVLLVVGVNAGWF